MAAPFTPCSACQSESTCTLQDECERLPTTGSVATDLLEAHDRYAQALARIAALGGEAGRIAREALHHQQHGTSSAN